MANGNGKTTESGNGTPTDSGYEQWKQYYQQFLDEQEKDKQSKRVGKSKIRERNKSFPRDYDTVEDPNAPESPPTPPDIPDRGVERP